MIRALDSGIEWQTDTSSTSNGPTLKRPPSGTTVIGISGAPGSDKRLASNSAAVNGVAKIGTLSCGHNSMMAP